MKNAASKAWHKGFKDGYICAVANILRTHDADRIARDVLGCIGPVFKRGTDPHDYDLLKAHDLLDKPPKNDKLPR